MNQNLRSRDDSREEVFQKFLVTQVNIGARKGSLFMAGAGLIGFIFTVFAHFMKLPGEFIAPSVLGASGVLFSLFIHILARRGLLKGAVSYGVTLFFVIMPSIFFMSSHFLAPLGTISYMHGPIVFIYFFIILLSGFFFDLRLSVLTGLLAGVGFALSYLLGMEQAQSIKVQSDIMGGDLGGNILQTDIISLEIFMLKAGFLILFGPAVGGLSVIAKRLMFRIMSEEEEKNEINRLFGQYVSDEVREKIKSQAGGQAGENKQVVILFSDLRNFTSYSESMAPGDIVEHLNEYFDRMVTAIIEEGGVVDKFMGDAVMAVFGGVLDLENPCESAFRAARKMQAKLKELNAKWAREGKPELNAGIGIHYGFVLQGNIGSAERKDFTVMGDTVNIASRLESATKKLQTSILLSERVYESLEENSRGLIEKLGRVRVKGKSDLLTVFGTQA